MTDDKSPGIYVVTADYGDGPEILEDEVYNDAAFAWQQADELAAGAEEEAVYGVYALVAVERSAT